MACLMFGQVLQVLPKREVVVGIGSLKLDNLDTLIEKVLDGYLAYGPIAKDGEYAFELIKPGIKPYLGCAVTMLPAKHVLQPVNQMLFSFWLGNGFKIEEPALDTKLAILGISPCDVHAVLALDRVFGGTFVDPYYWERRKNTLIIAANCTEVARESFCTSWGTGPELYSNYDLLLTEIADGYLVEVGSSEGEEVVKDLGLSKATQSDLNDKALRLERARANSRKKLPITPNKLHKFLRDNFDHPAWVRNADVCFSCGNCTFACPTCYCADIRDEVRPSRNVGVRRAEWDSCQILEFSEVALGANFRRPRIDRFKHRALHKLSWMKQQYGLTGCVGCGRCVRWCPSWPERRGQITSLADPVEIVADLMEPREKFKIERPGSTIV